jgi:thiamine pyrophosphate-dependent acetolactate synthase large subunit-like protein
LDIKIVKDGEIGMIKAENALARTLKAEGVPWVSTFPTCSVNNALGQEGVPIVMMREERYAAALADAFSRVTGGKQVGVCTVMGGVNAAGLQIAYGAIAQAFEDSSPMLVICNGVPAIAKGNTHFKMDLALGAVTKWIGHIELGQQVPDLAAQAFTHLRSGRRAPVLLTVVRGLEYDETQPPYKPVKSWKWAPDPDDVKAAIQALLAAKNPLLYVGEGVFYGDACGELQQFAKMVQLPVLTTLKGKSAFPENHPLSIGVRGELAETYLRKCDLLFSVGSSLFVNRFSHAIPDAQSKTIVQCTVDMADINRSYRTSYAVIGDAKLTLQALIAELADQTGGGRKENQDLRDEIKDGKEKFMAKYRPAMESNDSPINPYRVYGDLMKTLDLNNSFVTGDSGNTRDQLSTIWESRIPHGFLGWGNVSTLGFSLAAAAAAKLAYPERQCIGVTGDAGVGYMLGNLESMVRNKIGITIIHINNGGFSGYGPGFWGPGHDPYTCIVSDHTIADMSEAVKDLGLHAEHVTQPAEVIPSLKRAFDENTAGRPAYIEFICSQYPVMGGWIRIPGWPD